LNRTSWYKREVPLFEPLFDALNRAHVRYVVVGGVALVLHGYPRLTVDVDLVVDLAPEEADKAIRVCRSRSAPTLDA
jgi:tRNA nucleotidyltransferase/poly(A) polymerase